MKRNSNGSNINQTNGEDKVSLNFVKPPSNRGKLVLADGDSIEGFSFGAPVSMAGEVVFNTGMVGYPEALTDPSYAGQILVLTSPMIGNYGVPIDSKDQFGLPHFFESDKIHISGLIVSEYSNEFSHWNAAKSLGDWLKEAGIPALFGIDTRRLTKKIRETGAILGKIEFSQMPIPFLNPNLINLVESVSCKEIRSFIQPQSVIDEMKPNSIPTIIAFDCGMKYNIIRYFIHEFKVNFIVVPFDYDLQKNPANIQYDGIFVSNGPGDPTMCQKTIESLKWAINLPTPKPIFGICLGNQLLALASGAKTYKMKYGNRGMNQPCVDLRSTKCYITSQNHGFAVDNDSLSPDWKTLFVNANDNSNEGIIHTSKPFFSVQFHPEACGGPKDTAFLFKDFIDMVQGLPPAKVLLCPSLYQPISLRKVLVVGSGGLSIGQAGEFDYSGSQCIKALKEENIEVILINPNIATVQTSKHVGRASPDKVYFLPITPEVVEEIIIKERPDGVIVSMGGQTALNIGIDLYKKGIFKKYDCRVLGTSIDTIIATEDREIFSQKLKEINESLAKSKSATNIEEAVQVAHEIGFPVLVRAAFALGGLGSGFAENETELRSQCAKAFAISDQILIDQDLRGWKEIEYEVVRDNRDNCITVCNMENFDPLGVHTGDSIVVAPSQTLSNSEYFKLRSTSIKVIRSLGIIGECNIQYALNPHSEEYCIIEVNARLSRSSALASKATGYPLAYVATKLCLGKDLVTIRNSINKTTTACFEPSLDYCVIKVPRWDLKKFTLVSNKLGSSMTSVGEVMAIGRNFEEALQKACRMVSGGSLEGLEGDSSFSNPTITDKNALDELVRIPTDRRLYAVQSALERGYTIEEISRLSRIDLWFLSKLRNISLMKSELQKCTLDMLGPEELRNVKCFGFSDRQIARYTKSNELSVRQKRKEFNIIPVCKQIDTLAAEFPAQTNYLYMTYHGTENDVSVSNIVPVVPQIQHKPHASNPNHSLHQGGGVVSKHVIVNNNSLETGLTSPKRQRSLSVAERKTVDLPPTSSKSLQSSQPGVIVLGCGCYCIGSSVEFDWCAVSALRQIRALGNKAIVINYNPETVSTDYDESDALYFEELTFERVMDIYELENAEGVVVSVGGQIPNNLSTPLHQYGARILGTSAESIDKAEDRHKFSALLDSINVDQPEWIESTSLASAHSFATSVGYPVLVRPSFVLSGAAMRVASNESELFHCLQDAVEVSADKPVVISKFILNAKEIEFDGVAQNGHILNYAISEHVENAGVHSGDATLVLPAQKLYVQTVRTVKQIASQIAEALKISGPFNIQFLAKGNAVRVIECNLRASRTFPFISKTFDANFITLATKVMLGYPCKPYNISLYEIDYVAVKAPIFSFTRLRGADPTLGVEMSSTGEVACFGRDVQEAFLQALLSSTFKLPERGTGKYILVSIAQEDIRAEFIEGLTQLIKMGYNIACTPGTAEYYLKHGFEVVVLNKPGDNVEILDEKADKNGVISNNSPREAAGDVIDWIQTRKVDLVINIPEGSTRREEVTSGYLMRRAAVDFGSALLTNIKCATLFCDAMYKCQSLPVKSVEEYIGAPTVG